MHRVPVARTVHHPPHEALAPARKLLEESGNDLTWVAAQLGVNPSTLNRWRKGNKI